MFSLVLNIIKAILVFEVLEKQFFASPDDMYLQLRDGACML